MVSYKRRLLLTQFLSLFILILSKMKVQFAITLTYIIFLNKSYGIPTKTLSSSETNLESADTNEPPKNENPAEVIRNQRSPQFGLLNYYDDYSYDDYSETRYSKLGHKRKHHKLPHKPLGLIGGHGCRGLGCGGGWQPDHGGHYEVGHGSGSIASASASAGSLSGGGFHNGGHSQANAQSASFSFGPYTASFSVAQANSGRHKYSDYD